MHVKLVLIGLLLIGPGFAAPLAATSAQAKPSSLDTASIRALYRDGEFEKITESLNKAIKSPATMTLADSAFTFKHLGVIYAAETATREKGKYYLYHMLKADGNADILDMYASESINGIFKNIRAEFMAREAKAKGHDPEPSPPQKASRGGKKALYWAGGALALAGAGAGIYFLLGEPEKRSADHGID